MTMELEMPTPCAVCQDIFDLLDGTRSPRRPDIVICDQCASEEEAEMVIEEEIESLKLEIEESKDAIRRAKERLKELEATTASPAPAGTSESESER